MAGTALSVATDGLRDGRVNNIGPLVFPNLSLYGPCEQCVYIRFAMFVMVFGGLIAAINPKNVVLKLIGCIAAFYGSIMGIKFSLKLNDIHHAVHSPDSLFGVQGCSTDPTFPFNLPLANWAPEWFKPTGDCGYDAP
jgi:disulfide bond formation protein DsbB